MKIKNVTRQIRKNRIRSRFAGTPEVPRLYVFRSSKHIYGSIVDDSAHKTLLSASDKIVETKGTKTEKATQLGKLIGERAQKAGIKKVVFDRSGYLYHGRVKALADGARAGGLEF